MKKSETQDITTLLDKLSNYSKCQLNHLVESKDQANQVHTFIRDQLGTILRTCTVQQQSVSFGSTPITLDKQQEKVRGSKSNTPGGKTELNEKLSSEFVYNNKNDSIQHNTPRRASLFTSTVSHTETLTNHNKGHFGDFMPLFSSTPGGKGFQLGDFITPEHKKKRAPRKKTSHVPSSLDDSSLDTSVEKLNISTSDGSLVKSSEKAVCLTLDNLEQLSAEKIKKPTRRITPTIVSSESHWTKLRQQATFEPVSPKKSGASPANLNDERRRLRERKALLVAPFTITEDKQVAVIQTPTKPKSSKSQQSEIVYEPHLEKVTMREDLERLVEVYCYLITSGKTENIAEDLLLLIQVLCCQYSVSAEFDKLCSLKESSEQILSTADNCVYFAISTLNCCRILIEILDSSALRLLAENHRVKLFFPALCDKLTTLQSNYRLSESWRFQSSNSFKSVSFQADTDNSKNFPSDRSFLVFKKQRDIFYEIKREWDDRHLTAGFSLKCSCSDKIDVLLNHQVETSNYVHLARLFVNQLIMSCLGDNIANDDEDDDSMNILCQLKLTHPDKYRKLRERFVRPAMSLVGDESEFTGQELFFKQFIQTAKDAVFNQHLCNALTLKLMSLNGADFDCHSDQNWEIFEQQGAFLQNVTTSRLIAKFLGFINFMPYAGQEKITPLVEDSYRQLRLYTPPPLDLLKLIENGIAEGRSVLIIPWVVQYIRQLDCFSLTLPYYKDVLTLLWEYKIALARCDNPNDFKDNRLLMLLVLSGLNQLEAVQNVSVKPQSPSTIVQCEHVNSLNRSPLATSKLMKECSSALQSIRCHLIEYVVGVKSKLNISRKITPITAEPHTMLTSQSNFTRIHDQLEDSFFSNQPPSLRKSVLFVAERVASAYIKEFRGKHMTPAVLDSKQAARCQAGLSNSAPDMNLKEELASKLAKHSKETTVRLQELAQSEVDKYFSERVQQILSLMMPIETEGYVLELATTVTLRHGCEIVMKWLTSNVTVQYFYTEMNHELSKYIRTNGRISNFTQPPDEFISNSGHCDSAPSPTDVLMSLQLITGNQLSFCKSITSIELEIILKRFEHCIDYRCDVIPLVLKTGCQLILTVLAATDETVLTESILKLCDKLFGNVKLTESFALYENIIHNSNSSLSEILQKHVNSLSG